MPLPHAPSGIHKHEPRPSGLQPLHTESCPAVLGRDRLLLWCLALFWLVASVTFWRWWLRPEHVLSPWLYVPFTAAFAYYATLLPGACLFFISRMRQPRSRLAPPGLRVAMVTTCVPSCESLDVIERQLLALAAVTYPHDSWVLDDEGCLDVRRLAERCGVHYFSRAGLPRYNQPDAPFQSRTKAGNVNAWLDRHGANYEFFVQLDVDHRPQPDYLEHVLGFFADPRIAWVQAPSIYCNLDTWVSRGAAEQELIFQGPLQQGFYGHTETPFIIGSHTSYRMSAVLSIGGFQPTRAEDHLDTLVLAAHGHKGVFIPEPIAWGDGPESFDTYLRQQFAWARSIMQVLFGYTPKLVRRLQPRQVVQFLFTETWYLLWSLSLLTMFALPVVSLVSGTGPTRIWFPEFVARSCPLPITTLLLWLWSRRWHVPHGLQLSWRGILLNAARWPVVLWAFINVLFRLKRPYMITPKGGVVDERLPRFRLRTFAPYLIATWLSCGAICVTLTQRAYAGDGTGWASDSGVLGPAMLALWGALFMLAVYVVNVVDNISVLRRCTADSAGVVRSFSIPLLLLVFSSGLFVAATASATSALLQNAEDEWHVLGKAAVVAAPLFVEMPTGKPEEETLPLDLPNDRVALGAYDPERRLTSLRLDLDQFYIREDEPEALKSALAASRNRRVPLVTIEPYAPSGDARPVLDTILLGARDADIVKLADLVAMSRPQIVYVRWGQEMDLPGLYPWAANDPAMFRAAFRRVVTLFRERGASNVKWVWSPAGVPGAEAFYPGDDIVDDIGLTILGDSSWDQGYGLPPQSFADLLRPKYELVHQYDKPIIIAEMGVSGNGKRQRQWLLDVPRSLSTYPLVRSLVYFNAVNSDNNRMTYRPDWRISADMIGAISEPFMSAQPSPV